MVRTFKNEVVAILLLVGIVFGVQAQEETKQESTIVTDESSLFGESNEAGAEEGEGSLVEEVEPTEERIDTILLTSDAVEIGGRYGFSGVSTWTWNDPESTLENISEPDSDSMLIDLRARVFLDARPSESTRVFGKLSLSYPFDGNGGTRDFADVFYVDELFSDFSWKEALFLRGGKHAINWGVGYFFSPADLLNITEIDPEDPDAEREGPVSLKMNLPIDAHNLYLYLIANDIKSADEIGVAAKAEFVLGLLEIGVGGIYQKDVAPSGMLTFSTAILDVDVFAEMVLRYGSDKRFVQESDTVLLGLEVIDRDEEFFFNATAGLSFIYSFDNYDSTLSAAAQYLYNGEGYDVPALISDNPFAIKTFVDGGELSYSDLQQSGRHYGAANVAWRSMWGSDISAQAFWMHNFSDSSGRVTPGLSLAIFDGLSVTLSLPYVYGEAGKELSPFGDSISAQLRVDMGSSSF